MQGNRRLLTALFSRVAQRVIPNRIGGTGCLVRNSEAVWATIDFVSLTAADRGEVLHVPSAARALSGLVISGLLFGFLGAILPAWGYHLTSDFSTIGNYFLSMSAGVILSTQAAGRLLLKRGVGSLLVTGCGLACAALLYLAFLPPTAPALWRMAGLLLIGFATGLLNTGVFHAI